MTTGASLQIHAADETHSGALHFPYYITASGCIPRVLEPSWVCPERIDCVHRTILNKTAWLPTFRDLGRGAACPVA